MGEKVACFPIPVHTAATPVHTAATPVHTAATPVYTAATPVQTAATPVHTAVHTSAGLSATPTPALPGLGLGDFPKGVRRVPALEMTAAENIYLHGPSHRLHTSMAPALWLETSCR